MSTRINQELNSVNNTYNCSIKLKNTNVIINGNQIYNKSQNDFIMCYNFSGNDIPYWPG